MNNVRQLIERYADADHDLWFGQMVHKAAEDLERIFTHINAESPDAAQRVVKSIYDRAAVPRTFHDAGPGA